MREAFDEQLRGLLERIMEMGGLAEKMLGDAVAGLLDEDEDAFSRVREAEVRVNQLHLDIDNAAISLTIQQQPVARDVRMIFVASRCAADVERVGDQAVNISDSSRHYLETFADGRSMVPPQLAELASAARAALADALTALVTRDVALAELVLRGEPTVDDLRDTVFKELLYEMITRPAASSSALSLLLISRNLERVGDHATNIAEELIYLVNGSDIRHGRTG